MIRASIPEDEAEILQVAQASGLFEMEQLDTLRATFQAYTHEHLEREERWVSGIEQEKLVGVGYYVEEPMTDRVYNLLFIAVDPSSQGSGWGSSILEWVEETLREARARMLIIETGSGDDFAATRSFYAGQGYDQEGSVRDFYEDGLDKIVYRKLLKGC